MVIKEVKTAFIRNYCNRGKETQCRTWLNIEYRMDKWGFKNQKHGGDQTMERY